MRLRWIVLAAVALMLVGAWSVRAAGWSPVGPPAMPAQAYARTDASDPTSWQTLSERAFASGGASYHAEVRGFARVTSNALHAFEVRVLRTGGEDVRLLLDPVANGDVNAFQRPSLEEGVWVLRFGVYPMYRNASLAAELDVVPYRPAWAGFVEEGPLRLTLPFTYEVARDGADGS